MSVTITITKLHLAIAVISLAVLAPATAAVAFHVFDDVPDDAFFAEPVEWAFDNGITTGKSPTIFDPFGEVTRGESVTFAKRYDDNVVQPALAGLAATAADNTTAIATLDGLLASAVRGGNGEGVGNTICTVPNGIEVFVRNSRGELVDARFSYIVPDFDHGVVRSAASIRITAGKLTSVEHPAPGKYCLVFNATVPSAAREATIIGIHDAG